MTTLEHNFVEAMAELDLPQRDLEHAVIAELRSVESSAHRGPTWVLAVAAAVVAVLGIIAIPPARHAVADWLGIGATEIEVIPTDSLSAAATATTAPPSADAIGEPVEPESAAVPDPLAVLGPPLAVYEDPGRGRSFTWSPSEDLPELGDTGVGAVLSIRPADRELATKLVAADVAVEFVDLQLDGRSTTGLWIGGTHELVASGAERPVTAEKVLLWVDGGLEYRLELDGTRQEAIALAENVKGGTELLPAE